MTNSGFSIKNMSNELKVAYILIIITMIICVSCCFTKCCKKDKKDGVLDNKISEWMKNHPQEVLDSINDYLQKQQLEAQKKQQSNAKAAIKDNFAKIADEKNTGVYNKNGKKVIIEFFDYNCGYCKLAKKAIDEVVKSNKDVKVIFRDFPIFGGNSELAARYAIAVAISNPSKYYNFASVLFENGADKESKIKEAVTKAGLKLDVIEATLKNKKSVIDERLKQNREIGTMLGIQGTPAFIVDGEFVPGYIDAEAIKSILNK